MKDRHPLTLDDDPVENAVIHTAGFIHTAHLWHDGQLHPGLGHQDDPAYWARRAVGVLLEHGWTHPDLELPNDPDSDTTSAPHVQCRAMPPMKAFAAGAQSCNQPAGHDGPHVGDGSCLTERNAWTWNNEPGQSTHPEGDTAS